MVFFRSSWNDNFRVQEKAPNNKPTIKQSDNQPGIPTNQPTSLKGTEYKALPIPMGFS